MKIDEVPQVDKNSHGSSHRWPLIAETRELASAINSASHAASTVGRKGDCKGSLVTEHCVTQVYIATPRVLPASHSFPCHVKDIQGYTSPRSAPPGDNQGQTPLCLPLLIAPRLDFSSEGIQFSATITSYFNYARASRIVILFIEILSVVGSYST